MVGGFRFDRFHAHPRDLVFAGRRLVALEQGAGSRQLDGIVDLMSHGVLLRTRITYAGRPVVVNHLMPSDGPVVGLLDGRLRPGPPTAWPFGYASLAVPGPGEARLLPGVPLP